MNRNLKVAQAYSKSADSYDKHATIQKHIAHRLGQKILKKYNDNLGCVLEVGCGTGFLTEQLFARSSRYILSDISQKMTLLACQKFQDNNVFPITVDGELPCFTACFDMIVSNLALHWFSNPSQALQNLSGCLKPGGIIYFTCMGSQSFHEWKTAHIHSNAPCGTPDFISFGNLLTLLPLSGTRRKEVFRSFK